MNVLVEYKPLYFESYFQADCWGGRAGARSYSITQNALYNLLNDKQFRGFFLRQVHSTIYSSMWQDLKDRIQEYQDIHNVDLSGVIEVSDNKNGENYAKNLETGATITTKGFRISSGTQTANLKSLAGATHLYIDECEEVDESEFRKLKLSLRKKGVEIKIIRAFNPPYAGHWIWKDYEVTKIDTEELINSVMKFSGWDRERVKSLVEQNNKTYYKAKIKRDKYISIQTNAFNNFDNLNPQVFEEYESLMEDDFHYFCCHILGLIPNEEGDIVYTDYDEVRNGTDRRVKPGEVLHIGMDFNVTKMSAVIHVVDPGVKYAVSEITNMFDTNQMCQAIKIKFPGHKVVVYPDASGKNRKTSGKSDFDIIKEFGFSIRANNTNGYVRDRINQVNSAFRKKEYYVNAFECPDYNLALKKLKYKNGEPDKSSGFDHVTDAGGYFITNQPKLIKGKSSR
ncbi:MAG: phage terminase large subunit [Fusobacteriaceae bacterium]